MKNISKTIIFFGNERLVSGLRATNTPVLRGLIDHGYKVATVVSSYTDSSSRNNRELEVAQVAHAHSIPLLLPDNPAEILDKLKAIDADAAILVAYGRIIPQSIIDIFPRGIINIHPSLLPKYRGPTPIESSVANGDSQTGVSIMRLTAGMDEGPIYAQETIPLSGHETKFDLYEKQILVSTELLFNILPSILDGSLQPQPQDNSLATYCQLLTKADGLLNLADQSADQAERLVRAYLEFPKTKVTIMGHDVIITKAHVAAEPKTSFDLKCKNDSFLSIDELIAPSGRTMTGRDFLNGYAAA